MSPGERAASSAGLPAPVRSLGRAVVTGGALVAVLLTAYYLGVGAYFVLIAVASALATFEAVDALLLSGRRPSLVVAIASVLALLVVAYAGRPALFGAIAAASLYGAFGLSLRPRRGATPASDAAWTLAVVGWIGGGGAATTALLVSPSGLSLVTAVVLIAAASDIAAFFSGSALGRRKLAPSISPQKTWEGFAGGCAGAVAAGTAAGAVVPALTPVHGLALGVLCGLLGPAGDLVESLFKREMGIKDSGRLLPGHGGVLDRLDAILFCAPAAFLYLTFIVQ